MIGASSPASDGKFYHFFNFPAVKRRGSKIICSGISGRLFGQLFAQKQITIQGFHDMLPGPDGVRISDRNGFVVLQGPDQIGDNPVFCPVAAANHVSGSCRYDGFSMFRIFLCIEKGITIAIDDNLRTGLAGAVRIITSQFIGFAVGIGPFIVMVYLIGGDQYDYTRFFQTAGDVEEVGGTQRIYCKGLQRYLVGSAYDGLGSQVKDKIRGEFQDTFFQPSVFHYIMEEGVAQDIALYLSKKLMLRQRGEG